jgi:hypothetical protein
VRKEYVIAASVDRGSCNQLVALGRAQPSSHTIHLLTTAIRILRIAAIENTSWNRSIERPEKMKNRKGPAGDAQTVRVGSQTYYLR